MNTRIFDPIYWEERIQAAEVLHHSVYLCGQDRWDAMLEYRRGQLAKEIKDTDSILDVGCAWGGLLDSMPETWHGDYVGIDLSPHFIKIANDRHPQRTFWVADARDLRSIYANRHQFDVAVLGSIKGMVLTNMGKAEWDRVESEVKKAAKRTLILEYGDGL